ncbi:HNH endonuclease [Pseudomonas fluorescens group sp. PF-1]
MKPQLTFEQINSNFSYDPETGDVSWKLQDGNKQREQASREGRQAGTYDGRYRYVTFKHNGHIYMLRHHRIAWMLMTGEWPKGTVDHKDCDKLNNSWLNLRQCTQSQNGANKKAYGKSGFKGVSQTPHSTKWRAQLGFKGKTICLGSFETKEDAHAAYCIAAEQLHGKFAYHLSRPDHDSQVIA